MKITVDPFSIRHDSVDNYFRRAAEAGFKYIEFSQREDVWPYYTHPTANDDKVAELKAALKKYDLELATCLPLYRWSSPIESEREAAVRYWKRAIQITVDLGCSQMNSEFSGRPEKPEESEASFWRSMEELLPIFEKEGILLNLEPHPDDFIEEGIRGVDMVRAVNSPNVGFLYCAPHTFHQGGDAGKIIRYAGKTLRHLHIADTFDHTASEGARFITNPPGNTTRVHQHNPVGMGEVDWDDIYQALEDIQFDGIATSAIFSWGDDWDDVHRKMHDHMVEKFGKFANLERE